MNRLRFVAWGALALWVAAAFLLVPLAGKAGSVESTDPVLALPNGAEATRAMVRERAAFPGADTPVAVVVYVRDAGITDGDRAAVVADRATFAALSRTGEVDPAVPAEDGRALLLSFAIAGDSTQARAAVDRIRTALADSPAGLRTAVTGSAGAGADADEAFGGAATTLLLAAAVVVALLLLVMYRSPVLWILPLVSVGLASQLATGVVYLLGRYAGLTVTGTSVGILVVMLYGVGTDYALLLIARYREELRRHADRYTAMAVAWRRCIPALLASAATVVVAMLCLVAARMNGVRGFGPVAAAGILVTFAVMTTLLPALLVLLGRWVFWPFIPAYGSAGAEDVAAQHGIWRRLSGWIGRRPRAVWVSTALVLATLCLGVFGLRSGQPANGIYTREVGSVVGQRFVAAHYPSGTADPARIIASASTVDDVVAAARSVPGVSSARAAGISADGRWVRVDAVVDAAPASAAAQDTVARLRDAVHRIPGADALVGGQIATTLDTARATEHDNLLLMPLILVVVLGVLVLLLRAVVAPVLLAATVALSFVAAWGVAGIVLRAMGYPDVDPGIPLWCYLFLVALGVDYSIFLMTRAREEVARRGNGEGVLTALTVTGGVITSAGVVLAATFATLMLLPVVTPLQVGMVVATGVLLDTLVVRSLLVPALAVDIGARVWWPGRPARPRPRPRPSRHSVELAG